MEEVKAAFQQGEIRWGKSAPECHQKNPLSTFGCPIFIDQILSKGYISIFYQMRFGKMKHIDRPLYFNYYIRYFLLRS